MSIKVPCIFLYVRTFTIVYLVVVSGLTNMCEPDVDIILETLEIQMLISSAHFSTIFGRPAPRMA